MSPRAPPKTLGGAMPSMSDIKPPSGLWSQSENRLQFWAELQPGMLVQIDPGLGGHVGVFRVDAWGNVWADGAQSIVTPKDVLVVRVNIGAAKPSNWYLDLILGDSIWRAHEQQHLNMTVLSLNSSQASSPLW